ncbi:type II 3-dehydroquinate dehydratase [Corynebacterium lizhenjunii]|uniref:3-dehydroquinate dehydratase n=1 Tax=Corynebacterium lizhenjunii TaxID=2709394 RepID=A0A7T0KEH1_9CORY|nr:type II 3-dehydroquinate dehydratase [Corynebacterium lizhenjunii]QPK78213.1 type II 3-dehydroquinate dehydratase [Corynebacterium lizhenjunii]
MKLVVINGPNLNRLGKRQPEIYGHTTLADIESALAQLASSHGVDCEFFQSNHEGELIDCVHRAADQGAAVIINPGGYTHTSVALRDALAELEQGFVEVHISNVHAREPFRAHSYLSPIARGVIAGLGTYGYTAAMNFFLAQQG